MSDCRCSGAPGQNDTWDYHSDYCPVYMQGRIVEMEQQLAELRESAQAEVDRQRHLCGILRQELPPTTAALASLLQEKGE